MLQCHKNDNDKMEPCTKFNKFGGVDSEPP